MGSSRVAKAFVCVTVVTPRHSSQIAIVRNYHSTRVWCELATVHHQPGPDNFRALKLKAMRSANADTIMSDTRIYWNFTSPAASQNERTNVLGCCGCERRGGVPLAISTRKYPNRPGHNSWRKVGLSIPFPHVCPRHRRTPGFGYCSCYDDEGDYYTCAGGVRGCGRVVASYTGSSIGRTSTKVGGSGGRHLGGRQQRFLPRRNSRRHRHRPHETRTGDRLADLTRIQRRSA